MDWLITLVQSGETVDVLLHGSVPVVQRSIVEVCRLGVVVVNRNERREFFPWHEVRSIRSRRGEKRNDWVIPVAEKAVV